MFLVSLAVCTSINRKSNKIIATKYRIEWANGAVADFFCEGGGWGSEWMFPSIDVLNLAWRGFV